MAVNYRLGSNAYDQDFDFVETYVQFANGTITEDGLKSLRLGYVSSLYKYKDKIVQFINNYPYEVPRWMTYDYATYKAPKEYNEDLRREMGITSESSFDKVTEFMDRAIGYSEYVKNVIVTKYLNDNMVIISDEIRAIEENFVIERVQRLTLYMSSLFCLNQHPEKMLEETNYLGKFYCYLTNDTGLFGFNTWLYAYCNDVHIVGVPSQNMSYDFNFNECPLNFQFHDLQHIGEIEKTIKDKENVSKLYHKIIEDTETTLLQKELLITSLWLQVHEVIFNTGTILDFFHDSKIIESFIPYANKSIDLHGEYSRFRSLILEPRLLSLFEHEIVNVADAAQQAWIISTDIVKPSYCNLNEYSRLCDDKKLIRERIVGNRTSRYISDLETQIRDIKVLLLQQLVLFYYRQMCKKYY